MIDSTHSSDGSEPKRESDIEELSDIFLQVAEVPRDQQNALLEKLCSDSAIKRQVRELLQADASEDPLLDHSLVPEQVEVQTGERIDHYNLLKELARGGMGVVFLAEQTEPVRRQVALKVIKPGVDTREVIARFDAERQALSMMDHPNIAKVLDAGTTNHGRPYFVMELVKGQAITDYCKQNQLPIEKRLELFLPVCHAIQHAHQKGIIHRDIKPSNVLVAEYDGRPIAKVIDFGVAKAVNQSLTEITVATGIGQILGTFDYMSPEQSRVSQIDVDTRSDIYSLGVLLYELLTGSPPFDKERLRSASWEEMLRIIQEEDPPKPSSKMEIGKRRNSDPKRSQLENTSIEKRVPGHSRNSSKLGRTVRGELDWIVMKAMEKDRDRRYETPNQLSSDVECFLRGDAVAACPPSAIYLFRKFARRNKVVLATSAVVAASLVVGMIGTSWQSVRARRAEASAEAVNTFLLDDLLGLASAESQWSAGMLPDPKIKLDTLLERALDQLDDRFKDQPEQQANMKALLASSFNSIGRYGDAQPLYEHYLEYLVQTKGSRHPETLQVMRQLGRVYIDQSLLSKAEPLCTSALEISRETLGKTHNTTLRLLNDLGILYQKKGDHEKAEAAHQQCLQMKRQLLGDGHPDTLAIISNLAFLQEERNHFDDAEEKHERVLEVHRQFVQTVPLNIASAMSNLGRCYLKHARHDGNQKLLHQAEPLLKQSSEIYSTQRRPGHPDTIAVRTNLADVYCELRRYDLAQPVLEDLATRLRWMGGAARATRLEIMNTLGWVYLHQTEFPKAELILEEALSSQAAKNPKTPWALRVRGNLAIAYHRMGKLDKAVSLDSKTLELANEVLGAEHPETLACMGRLGLGQLEIGNTSKGRKLLAKTFDAGENLAGGFKIAAMLASSYGQDGDTENAMMWIERQIDGGRIGLARDRRQFAKLLAECGTRLLKLKAWSKAEKCLRECYSIRGDLSPNDWLTFNAQSLLGETLVRQQNYAAAKPLLLESHQGLRKLSERPGASPIGFDNRLIKSLDRLIDVYEKLGDTKEAKKWREAKSEVKPGLSHSAT